MHFFCVLFLHDSYASQLAISMGFVMWVGGPWCSFSLWKKNQSRWGTMDATGAGIVCYRGEWLYGAVYNKSPFHRSKGMPLLLPDPHKAGVYYRRGCHLDRCPTVRIHKLCSIDTIEQFVDYHLHIRVKKMWLFAARSRYNTHEHHRTS